MKTLTNTYDASTAGTLGVAFTSQKLIAVSTDNTDTGTLTISGSSVTTATLAGTLEVQSAAALTLAAFASIPSLAGTISIYRQGAAATFNVILACANIAHGTTLRLGLSGADTTRYRSYTFRNSLGLYEISKITAVADASSNLAGKYFDIYDTAGPARVWFTVAGVGSAPAEPVGGRLFETAVNVAANADATTVGAAIAVAVDADVQFIATAASGVVTVTDAATGTRTAIAAGTSGMTVARWSDGRAATAAGEVLIGINSDATATNLKDAINSTGTPGTQYIAPASAPYEHPILSAAVTNSVLTLTDRLACARGTGWTNTSGTGFIITAPAGGANGTLVATLVPPNTTVSGAFAVSNVDLSAALYFPPGAPWISDWVAMSGMEKATGATFYVMLQGDYTGTPWDVVLRYNLGASGNLAAFPGTATTTVTIDSTAVKYAFLQVPEAAESLKLFIDNTAGATATITDLALGARTLISAGTSGMTVARRTAGGADAYEVSTVRARSDVAGNLAGTYFDVYDAAGLVRVWFKVGDAGSAPATGGGRLLPVASVAVNADAFAVGTAIAAAFAADAALSAANYARGTRIFAGLVTNK